MCFSAGASFSGAAVLSVIGTVTLRSAKEPSQKLFAGIPLLFAFQQVAEGVLWLTIRSGVNSSLQVAATYFFLIMALIVWPVMIPASVLRLEPPGKRKKVLTWIQYTGVVLSAYYLFCMINFKVTPVINSFHIQYINEFPYIAGYVAFVIYVLVTIVPLFVSGVRKMKYFGYLILLSCIVTGVFYKEYLTSVWCFFAAIISGVIYIIILDIQGEAETFYTRIVHTLHINNLFGRD